MIADDGQGFDVTKVRAGYYKDEMENFEAMRERVRLVGGAMREDPAWTADPSWALERAHQRRWLRRRQAVDVRAPATRGFAAQIFAQGLGIRGGVWQRVSGDSARYAYSELKLLGMVPDGGPGVRISGDELSGLMAAAARFGEFGPERPGTATGQ